MTAEPSFLDWREALHYQARGAPCVHCGDKTPLRDDAGCASHKVCAEKEINDRDRR